MLICRQGTCERVAKERGYTIIPPYDHNDVIGGQVILVDLWLKKKARYIVSKLCSKLLFNMILFSS